MTLIVVLVSFNVLCLYRIDGFKEYIERNDSLTVDRDELVKGLFLRDLKLFSQSTIIDSERLSDIYKIEYKPCLIYAYSSMDCNSCIDEEIDLIRKRIVKNSPNNFLILTVFPDTRENYIQLKNSLAYFNYVNLQQGIIQFPITAKGNPARFFAILSENGTLMELFFPSILDLEKTEIYLDYILSKYF